MVATGFTDCGSHNPDDNLIAGEYPRLSKKIVLEAGNYPIGSVLGKVTATGKYKLSAKASSDGSEIPQAILSEELGDVADGNEAIAYFSGLFNSNKLHLGTGHQISSIEDSLREKSIFLKKNQE